MDKKQLKNLVKQIEKHKNNIAKERDALNDLISEFEDIAYNCDSAGHSLQEAIDELSQYL
ncbi:MAG: hypothetical protein WC332_00740 [Clostridia bacterium]|jgi:predicted  nucleic acid-binding Zn-ribbon protein